MINKFLSFFIVFLSLSIVSLVVYPKVVNSQIQSPPGQCTGIPPNANQCSTALDCNGWFRPAQCPVPSCGQNFTDTRNDEFYSGIVCLACRGIMNGLTAENFGIHDTIRRGDAALVFAKAAQFTDDIPESGAPIFSDVPHDANHNWKAVEQLVAHGVVNGCNPVGSCEFRYTTPLIRGEAAIMLDKLKGWDDNPTGQHFSDVPPNNFFYRSVENVVMHNGMIGYPDGTFQPARMIWRDELASSVQNSFFPNCPIVTPPPATSLTPAVSTTPGSCDKKSIGDTNCDGVVDVVDYYYYVRKAAGATLPAGVDTDVNSSGSTDNADRQIIVNSIKSFGIGT